MNSEKPEFGALINLLVSSMECQLMFKAIRYLKNYLESLL